VPALIRNCVQAAAARPTSYETDGSPPCSSGAQDRGDTTGSTRTQARLLAPGIVSVASGVAPHRVKWIVDVQQVSAGGGQGVCIQQTPIGSAQCFPFHRLASWGNAPVDSMPPVLLAPGSVVGGCTPPRFNVISGFVTRPHVTLWFKTPAGTRRIPVVHVDARFRLPGGVFATIITRGPVTLLARDTAGKTIYTAPVTNRGDKPSWCGGLDGGHLTPSDLWPENVKPRSVGSPIPNP
jgi:hypothetical protein